VVRFAAWCDKSWLDVTPSDIEKYRRELKFIEQSHRGIKQRYYPTLGFGAIESAKRFCQVFDEVKQFLRSRTRMAELMSLSKKLKQFVKRVDELQELF
jgi:transposase-like protein